MEGQTISDAESDLWAEDPRIEGKVKTVLQRLPTIFNDYSYHRTAQVFELQLGPFQQEELNKLRGSLVGREDSELGEVRVVMTKYHEEGTEPRKRLYHYRCEASYLQNDTMEPIVLSVKVDVNNRHMTDSLEIREMVDIWKHGQSKRMELLAWLIGDEEGQ